MSEFFFASIMKIMIKYGVRCLLTKMSTKINPTLVLGTKNMVHFSFSFVDFQKSDLKLKCWFLNKQTITKRPYLLKN